MRDIERLISCLITILGNDNRKEHIVMKVNKRACIALIFALSILVPSCTRIPYNEVVIPAFKTMHPSAEISQIYPIGGYGAESNTGEKTDIVIHFKEGGQSLEEIWTVTRKGGKWDIRFKCKSVGNVCVDEKGQTGSTSN